MDKINNYWTELLARDAKRPNHSVAIIDGHHYIIEDENSSDQFRGFGGDKFTITFKDGKVVNTTNLWYQGEIPEECRHLYPDNADFDWKWKEFPSGTSHLVRKNATK